MQRIGMIGFGNRFGNFNDEANAGMVLRGLRDKCVLEGFAIPEIAFIPGTTFITKLKWLRNHVAEFKLEC